MDAKDQQIAALQERVKQLELENETLRSIVHDHQERWYDQDYADKGIGKVQ